MWRGGLVYSHSALEHEHWIESQFCAGNTCGKVIARLQRVFSLYAPLPLLEITYSTAMAHLSSYRTQKSFTQSYLETFTRALALVDGYSLVWR